MADPVLLRPTFHVEVLVSNGELEQQKLHEIREAVSRRLREAYSHLRIGEKLDGFEGIPHAQRLSRVDVADYTGPDGAPEKHELEEVHLDVHTYFLRETEQSPRAQRPGDEDPFRRFELPHASLQAEWDSLVFADALPNRLLRSLVRMMTILREPTLDLRVFNWSRLCLLHGPPGSGKSTLCRAIAQKLSIRLGDIFTRSTLVEINANGMLSKYFGESGKVINATFDGVMDLARDVHHLVCVMIDEIETIACSRETSSSHNDCRDGLRATNQLLTALDRLRELPNVLILCTSNLQETIDLAFVDRVDINQFIPSPSPIAIYNIFRSCLNQIAGSSLVDNTASRDAPISPAIPTLSDVLIHGCAHRTLGGRRVWALANKCEGFSGRTLRRLPILAMAKYTWGSACSLDDAITALEAAVEQELTVLRAGKQVVPA